MGASLGRSQGRGHDDEELQIIWTEIDEAPALATYSLLPIVQAFTKGTGVDVETRDISLVRPDHRELPREPDREPADPGLPRPARRARADARGQHHQAAEHQRLDPAAQGGDQGAAGRRATRSPTTPRRRRTTPRRRSRRGTPRCLGSAVNPVLREGNSDRRSPPSVKAFSKKNPHKLGAWSADSKAHVAHMTAATSTAARTPRRSRRRRLPDRVRLRRRAPRRSSRRRRR